MAEINTTHQYNGREERSDTISKSDYESDTEGPLGSSSQSLKGSRPKKSAFQITSVEPKGKDNNHGTEDADSQDELEESRIDDASSSELLDVSNVSKGSLNSEIDKSLIDDSVSKVNVTLPDRTGSKTVPIETLSIDEAASIDGTADTNGNGPSRFRVVKVPNPEPVKRGRWTCKDFPSDQGQLMQEKSELGRESGDSSAASSVHYVPGENTSDPASGEEKNRSKKPFSRQASSRKTSVLDSIMRLTGVEGGADDEESAATAGAIDNKIEQAMDIVKGHLLMAVREEVEVLKEQIAELLDANEQLRKENTILREEKGPSRPQSQMVNMGAGSAQETQYQGIPPNQATQPMHTSSTYHQHSLQGQPPLSSSASTGAPPPTEHYPPPAAHHHHPGQEHPPFRPAEDQPTGTYHAIPSQQPPSTVTTNTAAAEQYHQQQAQQSAPGAGQPIIPTPQEGQYTIQQQQGSQQPVGTGELRTSGSLNPSQYQPHTSMGGMEGQYQQAVHHPHGSTQEQQRSQAVPPPSGAIVPQGQGESIQQQQQQQGHL